MDQQQGPMTVEQAMEQAQLFFRNGRAADSIAMYQRIITALPQFAAAYGSLALVYWDLQRYQEAAEQAQAALRVDPQCPTAHCALGLIDYNNHNLDAALPKLERAIQGRPDLIAAYNYAGMCCERLGDEDKALAYYETAVRMQPDHQHAHFNRALVWLTRGWYDRGWHEYEWRWLTGQVARPAIPRPRWAGGDLQGRKILVHTEQGIGDTLQFVRFLPMLKDRGAFVVFACLKQMKPMLMRTAGIDEWLPIDEPTAVNFDLYTPIGSIPGILRQDETNWPRKVPYVFPEPSRVEKWQPRIAEIGGFKVGLCWQGSKTFIGDNFRSIALHNYAPLAKVAGVKLISLQKGYGEEQMAENRELVPITTLTGLDDEGGAMMDTAAVMQHLDLVITSDTAVAHLAGSMGIPVWVALSMASDWRWQRHRTDSPWYPSMRLFRQQQLGDWSHVFAAMAEALRKVVSGELKPVPPMIAEQNASVPVAPGELFDKLAILQIKSERITDANKLLNVRRELALVASVSSQTYSISPELTALAGELKEINEELWDIEDAIRDCERNRDFGPKFIELARSVYRTNDRRAETKRKISDLMGSTIAEEKSYAGY